LCWEKLNVESVVKNGLVRLCIAVVGMNLTGYQGLGFMKKDIRVVSALFFDRIFRLLVSSMSWKRFSLSVSIRAFVFNFLYCPARRIQA
jgi:hypothetical protein